MKDAPLNPMSEKPLLILDLDETLISAQMASLDRPPDFRVGPYFVYLRPHLAEFLARCSGAYRLAVWTSSSEDYANAVVEQIARHGARFEFVWARGRCTRRFDRETLDQFWLKDLKKVRRLGYALERVLVVDDSSEKLQRHYGNHVHITPYFGEAQDDELSRLASYLESLASEPDFRAIEKRNWRARN